MSRRSSEVASMGLDCRICHAVPGIEAVNAFRSSDEIGAHYELVHECQICEMLCLDETARYEHLARAHGKRIQIGGYQRVGGDQIVHEPWRFVNVPGWKDPVESLLGLPSAVEQLVDWLNALCVSLAESELPELGLLTMTEDFGEQCVYVESRFRAVVRAVRTARYTRLKGSSARGMYLAKALTLPDVAPGDAEQKLRGV